MCTEVLEGINAGDPLTRWKPIRQPGPPTFVPTKAVCLFILYVSLVLSTEGK